MTKIFSLQFVLLVVLVFGFGCTSQESRKPNIIVILVDDMRWDEFGVAGHSYIQTPHIDRLAREGVLFENAFATTPLCSPSRACFLTGQYAHTNGIIDNTERDEQSHSLTTFPQALDSAGYETAFIGKWHMGNDDSRRPGFDHWVALKGQGEAVNPKLNIDGERKIVEGYVTDIFTDMSLKFIEKKRSSPFLLYLSHKALHPNIQQHADGSISSIGEGGFISADRHKGMYAGDVYSRRPNAFATPNGKRALLRRIGDLPPLSKETATSEETIRERAEMLMAVDEGLGKILTALESNGMLDNTVVVFTSDHGYWYGEHSLNDERRLAYEEGIRIPFLIRHPKEIPAGIKRNQMIQSIDLAPTLLSMAGLAPGSHIQGKSLLPVIQGTATDWRTTILIEYYSDIVFPRIANMGYQAVRNERYKYIQYKELQGMDELYDLQTDPYELHNLINEPDAVGIVDQMKEELSNRLKATGGK